MKTTLQRIKEYIDFKGIPTQKFEKSVGFSNGAFASQLKNNKSIGVDKLENILMTYPELDVNWLLKGKGQMIKADNDRAVGVLSEPSTHYGSVKTIPLVSFPAVAGKGSEHFGFTENDILDRYDVPKFRNKHVDFLIEVEGSSMVPKFNSGDVLACRIIENLTFIQWNKAHVVATIEQGIVLKRLKPTDKKDSFLMVSENADYDPFEVSMNDIKGIALVIGVIRLE